MGRLGFLNSKFKINGKAYEHQFVVCQHLITPVILGIDFMRKFDINISWGVQGRIQLKGGSEELVHSIQDNIQYPVSLPKNLTIPPRSVVSVRGVTDLPILSAKIMYKAMVADAFSGELHDQVMLLHDGGGNAKLHPDHNKSRGGKEEDTTGDYPRVSGEMGR